MSSASKNGSMKYILDIKCTRYDCYKQSEHVQWDYILQPVNQVSLSTSVTVSDWLLPDFVSCYVERGILKRHNICLEGYDLTDIFFSHSCFVLSLLKMKHVQQLS